MDPTACLDRAERAVRDMDAEEAFAALDDFMSWKRNGGFSSERDDARFEALAEGLAYLD